MAYAINGSRVTIEQFNVVIFISGWYRCSGLTLDEYQRLQLNMDVWFCKNVFLTCFLLHLKMNFYSTLFCTLKNVRTLNY